VLATTPQQVELARALFDEYATWLGIDLQFQGFDAELAGLQAAYAPRRGRLLLAIDENLETAGCVAMRPIGEAECEMKRLFVRPAFRGTGLGKRLALSIVEEAKSAGYSMMRLDTLPGMRAAIGLYETLGFRRSP